MRIIDPFFYCFFPSALPSRHITVQARAKPASGRGVRGSAKVACKTEPGTENPASEQNVFSRSVNGADNSSIISKAL